MMLLRVMDPASRELRKTKNDKAKTVSNHGSKNFPDSKALVFSF